MHTKIIKSYIVYLKNMIFFKVILIFFMILLLIWLMFVVKQDLSISVRRYNFVDNNISQVEQNLRMFTKSKDELLIAYKDFDNSHSDSAQENCISRQILVKEIEKLVAKYNLNEPLEASVTRSFKLDDKYNSASHIQLNYYDCLVNFSASDFNMFINLVKDIYALMPKNSFISFLDAKVIEPLNPTTVDKLKAGLTPNLISASVVVRLREIKSQ